MIFIYYSKKKILSFAEKRENKKNLRSKFVKIKIHTLLSLSVGLYIMVISVLKFERTLITI